MYFDCKGFFGIVLEALVDANFILMFVDVSTQGCINDGGISPNAQLVRRR
jgi:hypothetical protein